MLATVDRTEQYKSRLNIALEGSEDIIFMTATGLILAEGYGRVVIGRRGPYIEFSDRQVVKGNIYIPDDQLWRLESRWQPRIYYHEFRSRDSESVKIYRQVRPVGYADYKKGYWYISPFALTSDKVAVLVRKADDDTPGLFQ